MCAAISKYTKDGGPLFETRNVAERSVSNVPNGMVMKKIIIKDIRENFRTGRQKASTEFN